MNKKYLPLLVILLAVLACGLPKVMPTATPTQVDTETSTSTPLPTSTNTPEPTFTPEPSPTPTPIPLSEINLEPVLILPGDLPAGFSGAQVRDTPPQMFKDVSNYANAIYQQFEKGGEINGGVTVFLFESISDRDVAYQLIIDGFGKSENDSGIKVTVEDIPDIGEIARYVIHEVSMLGTVSTGGDLAFSRCHAVIHIRMSDIENVDPLAAYAKRLDKRLADLVCR